MQRIDPTILSAPVSGVNLRPGTLADQLTAGEAGGENRPTLLVFLRHFG